MLQDALDDIAEDTEEKRARLAEMVDLEAKGAVSDGYLRQRRWIGER